MLMMTTLNVQKTTCICVLFLSCLINQHLPYEMNDILTTECQDSTNDKFYEQNILDLNEAVDFTYETPDSGKMNNTTIAFGKENIIKSYHGKSKDNRHFLLKTRRYIQPNMSLKKHKEFKSHPCNNVTKALTRNRNRRKKQYRLGLIWARNLQSLRDMDRSLKHNTDSDNFLERSSVNRARKNQKPVIGNFNETIFKVRQVRSNENNEFNTLDEWQSNIESTHGRRINIFRLLKAYSLICSLTSCDAKYDKLYNTNIRIRGCPHCQCDSSCLIYDNCCPDSIYGYMQNECTCVDLYPDCSKSSFGYNMVSKCPFTFTNKSIINMCSGLESSVSPVISNTTDILYKNAFCASCNEDRNLTYMVLSMKCHESVLFEYKQILDTDKRVLKEKKCIVSYNLESVTCDLRAKPKINKCNISGLWQNYDADIEWVCNNLHSHFLDFRNIFCYICNPSISSVHSETLVSSCNVTGLWRRYNASFETACKYHGKIDRLRPYKNIYCALCNGLTFTGGLRTFYLYLSETLYSSGLTTLLSFEDNIYFRILDLNDITNIISAVEKHVHPILTSAANVCTKYEHGVVNISDREDFRQLIKDYSRVCGSGNICNKTLVRNETMISEENLYLADRNLICEECSCKADCVNDQNCCFDTLLQHLPYSCFEFYFLNPNLKIIRLNKMNTDALNSIPGYFGQQVIMIDKCINRNTPPWLRQKCEENNNTDILNSVPYSFGNIASKNIYCLICNKNQLSANIQGNIRVRFYCDQYVEPWLHVNTSSIFEYVNQNCLQTLLPRTRACVSTDVRHEDSLMYRYERLILANTQQTVIKENYKHLDLPFIIMYNYCNKTQLWFDENPSIQSVCESKSQSMLLLPNYNLGMKSYKNVACFICNPSIDERTVNNLSLVSSCKSNTTWYRPDKVQLCTKGAYTPLWFPYKNFHCQDCNLPPLYKIISHFGTRFGVTYRTIFSLKPDDWLELTKGEDEKDTATQCWNGTFDVTQYAHLSKPTETETDTYLLWLYQNYNCKKCRNLYCRAGLVLTPHLECVPQIEAVSNVTYEIKMLMTLKKTARDSCSMNTLSENITCNSFITQMAVMLDGSANYKNDLCHLIDLKQCLNENHTIYGVNRYLLINRLSIVLTNTLSQFQKLLMRFLFQESFDILDPSTGGICPFTLDFEISQQVEQQCLTDLSSANSVVYIDRCFVCPHFILDDVDSYVGKQTNAVLLNDVSIPRKYFGWSNRNVCICLDDFTDFMSRIERETFSKDMILLFKIHDIYSITCTTISLLCLLVTFLTYCFFQSLRTIAGKNNMYLVFALFFAQASLGLLRVKTITGIYCILTGIALHYFWLTAFFAMNVCAFHMLRMFSIRLIYKLYITSHTHLKYLLYSFCFPALIVSTTVVTNMIVSNKKYLGYGHGKCFLSDIYSFILAFVVPASVIFVSNLLFYFIALYNIKRVRNRVRDDQDRKDIVICLKLCTITGITWPLLIIDGVMGISWFSFIAVSMNALQGVFIFLSFICNTRVYNLCIGSLCFARAHETNSAEMTNQRPRHVTEYL